MVAIKVVGIGPAGRDLISEGSLKAIFMAKEVVFRTLVHPSAAELSLEIERAGIATSSFDPLYQKATGFDELYSEMVEELVSMASAIQDGYLCYVVPGSASVAESSVKRLRSVQGIELTILPSVSFLDLAFGALGIDPIDGFKVVDALELLTAPNLAGDKMLVAQVYSQEIFRDIISLLEEIGPDAKVVYLYHLGLSDQLVRELDLSTNEASLLKADHLTSLYVSGITTDQESIGELWEVIKTLRRKCPWDQEQTHESLSRHLLEESYEALEALDALSETNTPEAEAMAHFEEELGDLLIQVLFHSNLAREEGFFSLGDLGEVVKQKLILRHPHVFGTLEVSKAEEVVSNWEKIKMKEKGRSSVLEGIPRALPALAYSQKVIKKASLLGTLIPENRALLDSLEKALTGIGVDEESIVEGAAEVLYLTTALLIGTNSDPEAILRKRVEKLVEAIQKLEAAAKDGVS
ncbi:MAG: hypothetical protein HKL81_01265 [Acidimicrobiaceae bacterium]|nr:hypothetical protein [Acidimicrobiaceae bacterium]